MFFLNEFYTLLLCLTLMHMHLDKMFCLFLFKVLVLWNSINPQWNRFSPIKLDLNDYFKQSFSKVFRYLYFSIFYCLTKYSIVP